MTKMFDFVDKKRPNPIGGSCYRCGYCYIHGKRGMKNRFRHLETKYSGEFKLYPKVFEMYLKNVSKPMFFCDTIDWLHKDMPNKIITRLLKWISNNPNVTFLSLTKNPVGYLNILNFLPDNLILGFTVESNRDYPLISNAPVQSERIDYMIVLNQQLEKRDKNNKIFISIEPIMEFDFYEFINAIEKINPTFGVAIGYDNYHNKLNEPTLKNTLVLRKNLIADGFKVYDKTLRKAHWEK